MTGVRLLAGLNGQRMTSEASSATVWPSLAAMCLHGLQFRWRILALCQKSKEIQTTNYHEFCSTVEVQDHLPAGSATDGLHGATKSPRMWKSIRRRTHKLNHTIRALIPVPCSSPFRLTAQNKINCVLTQLAAHAILTSFHKGTTSRRLRHNSA
jgi:hypothetical protein